MQYWWVTQTDHHEYERSNDIVAGRISQKNPKRTHIGRKNVYKMNVNDILVCFIRHFGIDNVAKVVKKSLKPEETPSPDSPKGLAWVAHVKYLGKISPPLAKRKSI